MLLAQRRIEENLGLNTRITSKKNKSGKVTIEFSNVDQFDMIYKLLTNKR